MSCNRENDNEGGPLFRGGLEVKEEIRAHVYPGWWVGWDLDSMSTAVSRGGNSGILWMVCILIRFNPISHFAIGGVPRRARAYLPLS